MKVSRECLVLLVRKSVNYLDRGVMLHDVALVYSVAVVSLLNTVFSYNAMSENAPLSLTSFNYSKLANLSAKQRPEKMHAHPKFKRSEKSYRRIKVNLQRKSP